MKPNIDMRIGAGDKWLFESSGIAVAPLGTVSPSHRLTVSGDDDDGADVGRIVPVADDAYQQPPEDTRQSLTQDVALFANIEPEVPFRLHQSYEQPGDTKQVACAVCGRKTLEIGQGDRFTVARCPDCGHEECIHEG